VAERHYAPRHKFLAMPLPRIASVLNASNFQKGLCSYK